MKKPTRREFLTQSVLTALGSGMALSIVTAEDLVADPQVSKNNRGCDAGKHAILLDGAMAGWLYSMEGGQVTNNVISGGAAPQKHPRQVTSQDIVLTCGPGMSQGFYEWITSCVDGRALRKNGTIVTCDYNGAERSRMDFNNALITEVGFPQLDAGSKDTAQITIRIAPETTRFLTHSGSKLNSQGAGRQKRWLPSNFKLQIQGLDCSRVDRVAPILIKDNRLGKGGPRDYSSGTGGRTTSQLVVTLPQNQANSFHRWLQSVKTATAIQPGSSKKLGDLEYLG